MLDTSQNPLWNSDVGRKPRANPRRSHSGGKILNQPTLFLLVLVTLAFLATAVKAVDYLEDWEEEEADVSQNARLRFSILKVTFSFT